MIILKQFDAFSPTLALSVWGIFTIIFYLFFLILLFRIMWLSMKALEKYLKDDE